MTNMVKYVFRRGAAGSWSQAAQISEVMPSTTGYISAPRVALTAQGTATVAYLGYGVEVVRESIDQQGVSSWTPPFTAIPTPSPGSSYQAVDLAMDRAGNATLAASIFDANVQVQRASVWVAQSGAAYGAPLRLTDPATLVDAYARSHGDIPRWRARIGGLDRPLPCAGRSAQRRHLADLYNADFRDRAGHGLLLNMSAGSGTSARAIWKNAKNGTQTMAANDGN